MIRAVTFDLWDTLFIDDSDEPRRAAQGLLPKPLARERAFIDEVLRHHPPLGEERVRGALQQANAAFNRLWKEHHQTPSVRERLTEALALLGLRSTPGLDGVVRAWEDMEVELPPLLAPGVRPMLEALGGRYRLGVISDAIVTPGRGLRRILEHHGLLHYFTAFVFSDEAGASKPAPRVFLRAATELGVEPHELVHIGDRESNDVAGPHGVRARAVLYTGVIDRGAASTRADAVCEHHDALPPTLLRLTEPA